MKKTIFTGAATALITPLLENGNVDYETFAKLINWQIEQGIDALVIAGTTGEGSTLNDEEHKEVLKFSVQQAKGRVPIIAGTGSNDIAYAIELSKYAEECGCDALLLVTPYYNKATQQGLITSFNTIADATNLPVILYNVPSRTGCNILPQTALELSKNPKIVAIKEASGNLSQIAELAALVGDKLDIYSGNDDQILPVLSLGGKGVISVLSNPLPKETSKMVHDYLDGNHKEALNAQLKYLEFINALFSEVNPIPVKACMARLGWGKNILRLPLTPMEKAHEDKLFSIMDKLGL